MSLSNVRRRALWHGAALCLALAGILFGMCLPTASAQPVVQPSSDVVRLDAARQSAERAHLMRVGVWGGTALLSGATLLFLSDRDLDGRRAFGMQTAAWGAVNVAIAGIALAQGTEAAVGITETLGAENRLGDILWLNMGLNVGYVAVGSTLYAVGAQAGVARPAAWRGHGAAIVVQGIGLLILDGVALAASRSRHDALLSLLDGVALVPTAGGLGLTVAL